MKPPLFSWTLVALFAFAISSAAGLSYWWAVSVVVVAMILNGILAKIETRALEWITSRERKALDGNRR